MKKRPKRKDFATWNQYQDALDVYRKEKKIRKAFEIESKGRFQDKTDIQKLGILLKEKKRLQRKKKKITKKKKATAYNKLMKAFAKKSKRAPKPKRVRVKLPEKAKYFSGGYLRP